MRSLILTAAAIVLFGGSSTLAQPVRSTSTHNAPASGIASSAARSTQPPLGVLGTIPAPRASALGTIQFVPGTAAASSAGAIGSITQCPAAGIGAPASIDASNVMGITGVLPPQPLPGATTPSFSFGTSIVTGACNPATIVQDTSEFFNNTTVVPTPGLATITGPAFSDATISSGATEAGSFGQSPEIVVPTPDIASASPCTGNTTIAPTVITDPTTLMSGGTGMAATSSPPSLFGCSGS
jgi:hypothetical protein